MDFSLSAAAQDASDRMWAFMREEVFPAEPEWAAYLREHGEHAHPPVMERLKKSARSRGLWNLFLPAVSGLTNLDYAPVAEISGWSPVIAPEAINCQAPATRTSTGTPNSSSTRSGCRPPTCWPAKATASPSPRPG